MPNRANVPYYGSLSTRVGAEPRPSTTSAFYDLPKKRCPYAWWPIILGVIVSTFLLSIMINAGCTRRNDAAKAPDLLTEVSPEHYDAGEKKCIFTNVRCDRELDQCYVRPTEYESCMRNIVLDNDHVLQTIQNLDLIFQQSYPFYYTALDPNKTEPKNHQAELGYRLYTDKVDLHARLESIKQDVITSGGSMATFWDVAEVFHALRDAHVAALQGNIGNLKSDFFSGRYGFVVFSETNWASMRNGSTEELVRLKTVFFYKNETLRLDVEQYNNYNAKPIGTQRQVARVDGLSPMDFLLQLARSPLASNALKSVGPRVNALLFRNFPTGDAKVTFFQSREGRKERIVPHHILPDSFSIEYNDGSYERFYSRIVIPPDDYRTADVLDGDNKKSTGNRLEINISEIEKQANEPSCLHRNFLVGTREAKKSLPPDSRRLKTATSAPLRGRQDHTSGLEESCELKQDVWFTKAYNCSSFASPYDDDGPLEAGYRVMDGYVVLKLDSFDGPPGIIFPLWREINEAASQAGVHRLMIDISNNGGGEVPMGLNLARLMYPEVSCDMFDNKYDIVYNEPMNIWAQVVHPLLKEFEQDWFHVLSESDKVNVMAEMTAEQRKEITGIAEAMCTLNLDHDENYCGSVIAVRENCTLYVSAKLFQRTAMIQPFSDFIQAFFDYMKDANPWTLASEFDVPESYKEQTHMRGGVLVNFTGFLEHEPDFPSWWNCSLLEEERNVFSEYILVGNGNSGSTANTFQTTVEQMWKNRETSGAVRPLTTVSYGGIPGDTPLTQFAGGTVEDRVNVEDPFVGLAGLRMLAAFFDSSKRGKQLKEAFDLLSHSLPEVPFYLQQFPRLPAVEIYNKFMLSNGEAMPLEFVFMPPDVHIPGMYYGGVFDNPVGLEGLYEEASHQFHLEP